MTVDESIQEAIRLQHSGRLDEAENAYRQILETQPQHAGALSLLGAIALKRGDLDGAIGLLDRATVAAPDFFEAHRNLGALLAKKGEFDKAIAAFRRALQIRRDDFKTHFDLGNILLDRGELDEAVESFARTTELRPDFVQAHINLGNALSRRGLPQAASASYRTAAMLDPQFVSRIAKIGQMLQEKGRLDEAIAAYLSAIDLNPDFAQAHLELGRALHGAGSPEEAVAAYRNAARTDPKALAVHAEMASLLAKLERFDEALSAHACAAAIAPNAAATHIALGEILLYRGDANAAIESFRRATAAEPDLFTAWEQLGAALRAIGRFDEAAECFRRLIQIRPTASTGYFHLASIGKLGATAQETRRITELLNRTDLSIGDRISIGFAMGKALDAADRFDEAFAHYAAANAIARRRMEESGRSYDPESVREQVDELQRIFTPHFFEERKGFGDPSDLPVFVVGMPRSGTTLVHQIAASHPRVQGIGESRQMLDLAKDLRHGGAETEGFLSDSQLIHRAAAEHIQRLVTAHPGALRVIDKLPNNVYRLGLIAVLFPSARIVYCRRDARDTCLSCYFQLFHDLNSFSFDLAHCGYEFRFVERLMDHWRRVLPLKMLEVRYEELVADPEGQSRRLIDFLDLPWDLACLEFQRAPAAILTSSDWQVRQPIYHRSIGRWKHYQKHLGSLLAVLGR